MATERVQGAVGKNLQETFANRPRSFVLTVILFAAALLWPAAINGGPFWFPDTSTYIRGADAAYVAVTGDTTEWSDELGKVLLTDGAAIDRNVVADARPSKREAKPVLSGRSVYYGALLYAPIQALGAWGALLVQTILVAFSTVFALRIAVRKPDDVSTSNIRSGETRYWLPYATLAILAAFTPMAYYADMLMPDIFAGVICLLLATVIVFWDRMAVWEKVVCVGLACLIVTYHTTHVLLTLAVGGIGVLIVARMRERVRVGVITAVVLLSAVTASFAFSQAVQVGVGQKPMSPPFLSARIIDAGPGMHYLEKHCDRDTGIRFAVCDYRARLPMDSDDFLWSSVPGHGVFQAASLDEKRLLSEQDKAFYLAVLRDDPGRIVSAAISDTVSLLGKFDLEIFNYSEQNKRGFASKLPDHLAEEVGTSKAADGTLPVAFAETIIVPVAIGSLILLAGLAMLAWRSRLRLDADAARFATLLVAALLANAVICGSLSKPHGRYQSRIIWLLPLAAGVALSAARKRRTESPALAHEDHQTLTSPLQPSEHPS